MWRLLATLMVLAAPDAHADVQYAYDAAGRLVQVVALDGSSAVYKYDAAGNITAITRLSATDVAITAFTPTSAAPGASVLITGSGFSSTPVQVTFNGSSAIVTAASPNSLRVTVPAGATTGLIAITTSLGSTSSAAPFVVITPLAITGLSPNIVATGDSVTLIGTSFETTVNNNQVYFNTKRGTVNSATSTSMQTKVSAGASSGRVKVTTSRDVAESAVDLFIVPSGVAAADVVSVGRVVPSGAGQTVTTASAGKAGIVVFDGNAGDRISVVLTAVTMAGGTLMVYRPNGPSLFSGTIANNVVLDSPILPDTGTYAIVLKPGTNTGSATVTVVREVRAALSPDGTPLPLSLSAGQNAWLTFGGTSGQPYSLALTGLATTPSGGTVAATILKPDGSTFAVCGGYTASAGNCDLGALPSSGNYSVRLDPNGMVASSFGVVLSPDQSGTLTIDAAPVAFSTSIPGQNIRYTFSGTAGQRVTLVYQNNTIAKGSFYFHKPDGGLLAMPAYTGTINGVVDLALPTTGTYDVVVYVDSISTGHMDVKLVAEATGTLVTDGTPTALSLASGQNASYTFSAVAGQQYSVALTGFSTTPAGGSVGVAIIKPDGTTLLDCGAYNATSGNCDPTIPTTGTYTVRFNPSGLNAASFNVMLSSNLSGSLTIGAAPVTFSTSIPGQNIRYTFSGTAGQRVTFVYQNNTIAKGSFYFHKPDGSLLATPSYTGTTSGVADLALPATGTYDVVVYVDSSSTGHMDVKLVAEATGMLGADGTPTALSLASGQNASYTFSGVTGQQYSLALTGFSTTPAGGSVSTVILKPDGTTLLDCGVYNAMSGSCDPPTPTTGTYTVRFNPSGLNAASFNVVLSPNLSGTLTLDAAPVTFSTSIPGQNIRYTFSGTAGQLARFVYQSNTLSKGAIYFHKPDGSLLTTRTYDGTSSGFVDLTLPTAGTYDALIYVDYISTGHMDVNIQSR